MQKIHTDRSGSDGGGAVETAADKGRSFLMSNLTLDEYNMLQQMMKAMFMTKTVYDTCNVCLLPLHLETSLNELVNGC